MNLILSNVGKKSIFMIFMLINTYICQGQNFQLHYDLGKDRNYFTSTFEMYKPDNYGSTFWFIDMDFNNQGNKSISLVYMELARYFSIPGFDYFQPTIQYNDGSAPWGRLGPVWLAGLQRRINIPGLGINFDLLYRNDYLSDGNDAQVTLSWFEVYYDKLVFTGFLDLWSTGKDTKELVLLSEPQLWYKIWSQLSIGGEIEFSSNFISHDGLEINPTIGFKWDF